MKEYRAQSLRQRAKHWQLHGSVAGVSLALQGLIFGTITVPGDLVDLVLIIV